MPSERHDHPRNHPDPSLNLKLCSYTSTWLTSPDRQVECITLRRLAAMAGPGIANASPFGMFTVTGKQKSPAGDVATCGMLGPLTTGWRLVTLVTWPLADGGFRWNRLVHQSPQRSEERCGVLRSAHFRSSESSVWARTRSRCRPRPPGRRRKWRRPANLPERPPAQRQRNATPPEMCLTRPSAERTGPRVVMFQS